MQPENELENYQDLSEPLKLEETSLFNISIEQLKICLQEGIDLGALYLLEAFKNGTDLTKHLELAKILTWKQTLIRKALIDEQGYITIKGEEVLVRINDCIDKKTLAKLPKNITGEETPFDRWWKAYPATDNYEYKGKNFKGIRTFKKEKIECMTMYNRLLINGRFTEEDLIGALNIDLENRKEESLKTGDNKMRFLQNTATYLRQCSYEPYVELYKKGIRSQNNEQSNDYFNGVNI